MTKKYIKTSIIFQNLHLFLKDNFEQSFLMDY